MSVRTSVDRPRLLDLFCCQGGASAGYVAAGFDVVGVDIEPQPRYPWTFVQADALSFLEANWRDFDAVHASPPCDDHTQLNRLNGVDHGTYDLLPRAIEALRRLPIPWVVENVEAAGPLMAGAIKLCGTAFGLADWRHRLFLSDVLLMPPGCWHPDRVSSFSRDRTYKNGRPALGRVWAPIIAGKMGSTRATAAAARWGLPWMDERGVAQTFPPAFTECLGEQLMAHVGAPA